MSRGGLEPATPCLKVANPSKLSNPQATHARKNLENTNERCGPPSCLLVCPRLVAAKSLPSGPRGSRAEPGAGVGPATRFGESSISPILT